MRANYAITMMSDEGEGGAVGHYVGFFFGVAEGMRSCSLACGVYSTMRGRVAVLVYDSVFVF